MSNKLFSIIVPTYNCENLIVDTLESILRQDEKNYECIVVDGVSTDKTLEIVNDYSNKYSQIKVLCEKDNGVYDAMNKGIRLSEGEYLYFIGAGDLLCENVLLTIKEVIDSDKPDFILGKSYHVSKNEMFYVPQKKSDMIYEFINHQAIFYKNNLFKIFGEYRLDCSVYADNVLNKMIFGRDDISKKIVDVKIADYKGGGISENNNLNSKFVDNYEKIIVEAFGKDYLKSLYKLQNIKSKKIIAWGNGGEYVKANNYKSFNIEYYIKSKVISREVFNGKEIKSPESLLLHEKNEVFVLVYSQRYYSEIRLWLEENGFKEYDNFILATELVFKVLDLIEDR
ncbi:glycosyltransferase [Clostridium saccharoperbutylacetonicum]